MTHHRRLDETRRWKSWRRRRGAPLISTSLLLFFLSRRLANGESLPCFPKPIWAPASVGLLPIKMIVRVSDAPDGSCPPSRIFTLICNNFCFLATLSIWVDGISWTEHMEQGNYSGISDICLPWPDTEIKSYLFFYYTPCEAGLSLAWHELLLSHHSALLMVTLDSLNYFPGHNWKLMNSTAWEKKTPSHDYLVPNWAKDGNDQQKKHLPALLRCNTSAL